MTEASGRRSAGRSRSRSHSRRRQQRCQFTPKTTNMLPRPVFFSSSEDEPFRPVFGEILRLVGYLLILKDNLQKASQLSGVLTPASFTLDVRGASARVARARQQTVSGSHYLNSQFQKKARTRPSAIAGTRYHRDRRRAQKLAPVPTSTYEHAVSSNSAQIRYPSPSASGLDRASHRREAISWARQAAVRSLPPPASGGCRCHLPTGERVQAFLNLPRRLAAAWRAS